MSLAKFEREVLGNRVSKNDELWFPKWLRRYAMSFPGGMAKDGKGGHCTLRGCWKWLR